MNAFFITLALLLTIGLTNAYDDQNLQVSTSNTAGSDMVGSTITVNYIDGASEVGVWQRVVDNFGQSFGDGFFISFFGSSTFPDLNPISSEESRALWTFIAVTPVRSFVFDLSTGAAVWDILSFDTTNDTFTPQSGDGFYFRVFNTTDASVPVGEYSGVPTFMGRQNDTWYVLTVTWDEIDYPDGFSGVLRFLADTDSLIELPPQNCTVLPTLGPLEVNYVPDYAPEPQFPTIYTDSNGVRRIHIEFLSRAATNRRTGINEETLTWIYFGSQPGSPVGCTPSVDYTWQYNRTTDMNGVCYDLYTLDWIFNDFVNFCPVTYFNDTESDCGSRITGVITVRTITDRVAVRTGTNIIRTADTHEWSQHGFEINFGGCAVSTNDIRVYAATEITAIIDEYYIPAGATEKSFYITTLIQDPRFEGFRLVYVGGVIQITDPTGINPSNPTPEQFLLTLGFFEQTTECITTDYPTDNGTVVQLCSQRWLLSVIPDPRICVLDNVFISIPFQIVCNNPDPLLCPLDNTTDEGAIVVQITTDNFCPVTLSTFTLSGRFNTYRSDFRARAVAFFSNQTVGFEYILDGINPAQIRAVRVTYLSGVLGATSNLDLYPPRIYDLIANNASAAILIGATPESLNRATDVNLRYVCPPYPRVRPYPTGCAPNYVRFTLVLLDEIWPIRADDSANLRFGITVAVDLINGAKKEIVYNDVAQLPTATTIFNLAVKG